VSTAASSRPGPSAFDVVVVVDWSASSVPKQGRDSIWVAVRHGDAVAVHNPSTRLAARDLLVEVLERHTGRRVLLGVDVALGYPAGSADVAFGPADGGAPAWRRWWRHLADQLVDGPDNGNNRFAVAAQLNAAFGHGPGPFWGTTTQRAVGPHLARTKTPGFPYPLDAALDLPEFRCVEQVLRGEGLRPASVWQLAGAGAVGSQTLTCIPILEALRGAPGVGRRLHVWPFETGFVARPAAAEPDAVVVAEVWPTLVAIPEPRPHPVKDASQVLVLSERLAADDRSGALELWFDPGVPTALQPSLCDEEGWVLGVRWPDAADSLR
jgi:precorrin-8X/cobalt-precorrin-8 methylmutase